MKTHRGTMVLVFGILSLVFCAPLGIAAWIMGSKDLKEMAAGTMDSSGRGTTNAGRICGIIGTMLLIIGFVVALLLPLVFLTSRKSSSRTYTEMHSKPVATKTAQVDSKAEQVDKSILASRLDAAKAISNTTMHDEALAQLAVDAATSGDVEVAKQSVNIISNSLIHDQAAQKAALLLAKAGKGDGAVLVARLISNSNIQNETLAKIAKGEFGQ